MIAIETEVGRIVTRSRLGLDQTLPPRRAHLVVQDFNIQPKREQDWRIQSAEAVHDWRSGYSPLVFMPQHKPSGKAGGPVSSHSFSIGLSGPTATYSYSQPNVTRTDLSEDRKAKWRWRWNRDGRSSETFNVGSLVTATNPAKKGDHLCVVRSGATFRRGLPLLGRTGKLRVAQAFRYE